MLLEVEVDVIVCIRVFSRSWGLGSVGSSTGQDILHGLKMHEVRSMRYFIPCVLLVVDASVDTGTRATKDSTRMH